MQASSNTRLSQVVATLVASLGNFVDVYDIAIFSAVRVASLQSLYLGPDQILEQGVYLYNFQMIGMLIGGFLWGILGDKIGRVQVLFGSILLYSVANIANAYVGSIEAYYLCRFVAGLGLAGEMGGGITLVSELLSPSQRGWGVTSIVTAGMIGGIAAGLVAQYCDWRTAYLLGGVGGLALLFLRVSVHESGIFSSIKKSTLKRGSLPLLVSNRRRLLLFLSFLVLGLPLYFSTAIILTLSPEVASGLGIEGAVSMGLAVTFYSAGTASGDLVTGVLSQLFKNRLQVIRSFFICAALTVGIFLIFPPKTTETMIFWYLPLGFFAGYWTVLITSAAEHFGTNLRATVTTSLPNLIRGSSIPLTIAFASLKPSLGASATVMTLATCTFVLASLGFLAIRETFSCDLNFSET